VTWGLPGIDASGGYVMNDSTIRKLTGALLILTPVAFNVFFT
jgi:hypothetical protein